MRWKPLQWYSLHSLQSSILFQGSVIFISSPPTFSPAQVCISSQVDFFRVLLTPIVLCPSALPASILNKSVAFTCPLPSSVNRTHYKRCCLLKETNCLSQIECFLPLGLADHDTSLRIWLILSQMVLTDSIFSPVITVQP